VVFSHDWIVLTIGWDNNKQSKSFWCFCHNLVDARSLVKGANLVERTKTRVSARCGSSNGALEIVRNLLHCFLLCQELLSQFLELFCLCLAFTIPGLHIMLTKGFLSPIFRLSETSKWTKTTSMYLCMGLDSSCQNIQVICLSRENGRSSVHACHWLDISIALILDAIQIIFTATGTWEDHP
jgi:hypothetical protein